MWPFKPPTTDEKIRRLKKKCSKLRTRYQENMEYLDCGHHMAQIINPGLAEIARKYDEAYIELAALDTSAPPNVPMSR